MQKHQQIYLTCLLLLFALPHHTTANKAPLVFDKLSVEDGLSQGNINDILCDNLGFMWFATQDGLNMYDGNTIKIFKPEANNPFSLSNNVIKCIYEDKQNTLWVGTAGGGLNKLDRKTLTFTHYKNNPNNPHSISDNNVYTIFEDSRNNLWIGTYGGGLNKMNRETGEFSYYLHDKNNKNSITGNSIRSIAEDKNGTIWIGVDEGGLCMFDTQTETFSCYLQNNLQNSISSNAVLRVFPASNGIIWIGTWGGGVNAFNPKTKKFTIFVNDPNNHNTINSNEIFDIYEDREGNMYFTTRMGLDKYLIKEKKFIHNENNPQNNKSISHNLISRLYEDKNGILWIGTEGGGLNKLDLNRKNFHSLTIDHTNNNKLSGEDIFSLFEDTEGYVWIGTKGGGVNRYNPQTGEFAYFLNKKIKGTIGLTVIRAIDQDTHGNLWLGTDGAGIIKMDKKTGAYTRYYHLEEKNSISNNAVYAIHCEGTNIWIGTYGGGLDLLDTRTMIFTNYPINVSNSMKNVVLCIYKGHDKKLWIGTAGMGLLLFDKENHVLQTGEKFLTNSTSFSNDVITTITQDSKSNLWIGTGGGGLDKLDLHKGILTNYTKKNGLPNEMITGIIEDNNNNIWISSNNGLSCLNPVSGYINNYTKEDGLQGSIFNLNSYLKTKEGKLYFGGINGVNYFHPDSILMNPHVPNAAITDIKVFNKSLRPCEDCILKTAPYLAKEIELSYSDKIFSIEFAALHYVNPSKNKYKYMLEGFDSTWIETPANRRIASYTNLNGGTYTFKVMVANNDGLWNKEELRLKIYIKPPFWKTNTFYIISGLIVLLSIIAIIKHREKKYKELQIELETKVKIRTEEINTQKEELQLINEQLNQQKEELRSQSEYLREINNKLVFQKEQLEIKQNELETTNQNLASKNILITDSINYAQKIQESILPSEAKFKKHFNDYFIYFNPRDIVSGDFYWLGEATQDEWGKPCERTVIAAVDCTGHGVPGAFMSMIGNTLLNEIVLTMGMQDPAQILQKLHEEVIAALAKEGQDIQDDGMDISICTIDKELGEIYFSGAMQKIYIVADGIFNAYEGDFFSIGEMLSHVKNPIFTNKKITFDNSVIVYMFSDGYQDQFGGPDSKKFKESKLRELIKRIYTYDLSKQKEILSQTFNNWKDNRKQIDDVLILGLKIQTE